TARAASVAGRLCGAAAARRGRAIPSGRLLAAVMTENILEIQGLAKRFPVKGARKLPWRRPSESSLLAVHGVDFAIVPGETVGLVGESGFGKSTLVRLVTRLLDASAGRIGFAGEEIGEIPARRFAR